MIRDEVESLLGEGAQTAIETARLARRERRQRRALRHTELHPASLQPPEL